ncbi:MAG: Lrp/AsnC family transcriptional regulator [Cellulomonadaceae bacterium]
MDSTDRTILATLSGDGRATLARLAEATGLSTSAVQARVQRLERAGTIRGYQALLDLPEVGLPTTAFVEVTPLDPAAPDDVPEQLASIEEITACYSVAGDSSYLLLVRVAAPSDIEDLLHRIRAVAGVRSRTTVVLRTYFENRPPALP